MLIPNYKVGDVLEVKDLLKIYEWFRDCWSTIEEFELDSFGKIIIDEIAPHDYCAMLNCQEKFNYYFRTLDGNRYGMFAHELDKYYKVIR